MNILVVSPKFHPIVGGGETFVLNSLEQLYEYGDKVCIATEPHLARNLSDYPYDVHEIAGLSDTSLDVVTATDGLFQLINLVKPDILHVHGYFGLLAVTLANRNEIPVIASIHSTPVWGERIVGGMSGFDQERLFAEKIIAFSKPKFLTAANDVYEIAARKLAHNNTQVRHYPYPIKDAFYVSHNPVKYRKLLRVKDDEVLITIPSRIIERKGIREAVQMLEYLPAHYKLCLPSAITPHDAHYWAGISGSKEFKKYRSRIIIPKAEILHDQMPLLYAATDIVCMPSYYEGAPVATVEAMASRKPFVGYDSQGINGFIKSMHNGILVPRKSIRPLAEAIVRLAEDTLLSTRLANSAHQDVLDLSWERQLPKLRDLYTECMSTIPKFARVST